MSVLHLAISLFISSFTMIVIMLIRKLFKNQLSSKWKYNLWFLLLFALLLPYIPTSLFRFWGEFTWNGNQSHHHTSPNGTTVNAGSTSKNWMHDFSSSVNRMDWTFLNHVFTIVWIAGMLVMIVFTVHAWMKLRQIKKFSAPLTDNHVLSLFEQCNQMLNISRPLVLMESQQIRSPMTFGLFKTYIILPIHTGTWFSTDEIKYMLLHELHHYKYKDIATNYLIVLFQTLYWFHPLIWIAFREMRLDREIACDSAVLNRLDPHEHTAYGNTILTFADKYFRSRQFAMVNQLASSKKQLKKRMERIAAFTSETKAMKRKSILIFLLVSGVVLGQMPIVSAMPDNNDHMNFDDKHATYEDLSKFFNGYDGSFVLYDLQEKQYDIYNKDKSTLRVSPNSTYKIYDALFALESEIITRNDTSMKWNGKVYPYQSWNQDQNLFTAMENSVTWYFQRIDKKLQLKNIESYLSKIQYGNQDLSGGIGDFWLESSLKISPIEQVQKLKEFYTNQFGFHEKNIQFVKDSIKLESKNGKALSGKTGTGTVNGKDVNGWFLGYVETENNTYFFAANIQNDHHANGSTAAEMTKNILHHKGIY